MLQGSTVCCIKMEEERKTAKEERNDLHFKPPGEDLCGQIRLSLCLSLMFSFCLTLTDLLRGGDQNESPAPFSLHPVLSLRLTSTDSIFSSLPGSAHVPQPAYLAWSLTEKNKEESWLRKEDEEEEVRREGEKYLFFFLFFFLPLWFVFSQLLMTHPWRPQSVLPA